jgi:eukaryotic-like serine/threonine-protein kinase
MCETLQSGVGVGAESTERLVDLLIGRTLGPYELQARLGAGGMGVVYRALHRRLAQYRAVKVLPANLAGDPALVLRFEREARLAAELDHPNIVRLFDVNEHDGIHYLVMALLSGRSLQQILAEDRPLPLDRTLHLLGQLGAALDFAHARGVVHRDVKPANAFVSADDHLTLVDFGIAMAGQESRLTGVGQVIGTPEYLAPEVVTGQDAGPSADLYALGVIAYEMLTGRVPFTGTNSHAILLAQARDDPPPPRTYRADMPDAVQAVLLRQLAKVPEHRFRTAGAFVSALAGAAAAQRTAATETVPTSETEQLRGAGTLDGVRPTPAPRPSGRISGPLPAPPLLRDERGSGQFPDPNGGRDGTKNGGRSSLPFILACVAVAVLIVLLGAVASVAMGGRESPLAKLALGPVPTPTPLPTATLVPTATAVPTATPVPGPRLADLVGNWTAVSSNTNGGPATPETAIRLSFTLAGDRALMMTRVDRSSDQPVRFDYQRTDGQTLIGQGSSNGQGGDMAILVAADGRQITMTIRPTQGASAPRDTYGLILRRT